MPDVWRVWIWWRAEGSSMTFDEFWQLFPRREAKKDARKAWDRLHPSPEVQQQIATALEWQCQTVQWTKGDGQFVPYPASYLRGERWTDERRQTKQQISPVLVYPWTCPHTPRCPHRVACQIVSARTA